MGWLQISIRQTRVFILTLPNFLIIGAAKSGTSSLYMYLKQHPQIFMSPVKEPHFFSFTSESKMTKGPGDPIPNAITNFEEYLQLFNNVEKEKAIGEASTSYLYRPEAAKRIFELIPNAKLIAILRNPTERAFSAYMHVVRDQRESAKNFNESLLFEKDRIEANWDPIWHFTNVGFYFKQISRYYQYFKPNQIKIFLYDELVINRLKLLIEIFNFLNVNPNFLPVNLDKFNVSGQQKNKLIYFFTKIIFQRPNPFRWLSRQTIPENLRWKVTNWIRANNLKKQEIPPKIRNELIDLYREDIINLESLINKDLSLWLEKTTCD